MRRGLGRGRTLVAIGAVIAVVGAFLPWTFAGGDVGLPVTTANAFDGAGILMFIAAIALLALLILPYASSSGRSSLDRWVSFVLLATLMVIGTLLQLAQLFSGGVLKLAPAARRAGHVAGHPRHHPRRVGRGRDRGRGDLVPVPPTVIAR